MIGKMVSVADVVEEIPDRFINRERFEEIKSRVGRLPSGDYRTVFGNKIVCNYSKDGLPNGQFEIAEIHFLGAMDAFLNLKKDMEDLLRHVENADIENDLLIEKLNECTKQSTS